jgi:hypothetical protein
VKTGKSGREWAEIVVGRENNELYRRRRENEGMRIVIRE